MTVQLAPSGYEIRVASSPAEARLSIAEMVPDAILLDVVMPTGDGIEFCAELRKNPKLAHTPIVLATALDSRDEVTRGLEAGADEYLTKPIYGPELRVRLANLIAAKFYRESVEKKCAEAVKQVEALRGTLPPGQLDGRVLGDISGALEGVIVRLNSLRTSSVEATGTERLPIRVQGRGPEHVPLKKSPLTKREREVLASIAGGKSSRAIGVELGIAIRTVEAHRARICLKLDIRTIAGLTRYAMKVGLAR